MITPMLEAEFRALCRWLLVSGVIAGIAVGTVVGWIVRGAL